MKKNIFMLLVATAMIFVEASTPMMSKFPEKYETWINHKEFETGDFEFDFHNYETSFTEQVCGFDTKNYRGSWYGYKISKYIVNHRSLFNSSVPFVFNFIDTSCVRNKKNLRTSLETFKLLYDDEILELKDLLCISYNNINKNPAYSAIHFLGYLEKETFLRIAQSGKILLQFDIDGKEYKFDLQIPKIYEDTFPVYMGE